MPTEPSVRFSISNEYEDKKKAPMIANLEDFDEETEIDEIDSEFTPLNNGDNHRGVLVPRKNIPRRDESPDPNPDRRIAGFYPQWPTYYPDTLPTDPSQIPSLNLYQQRKSMAQGMLDLALLSANANQLRYVLDSNQRNHYFYVSMSLIGSSLVLQILVAIALVFKSRYNIDKAQDYENADRINNFILIGILLITIFNVISSAFAPQT